MHDGRKRVVAAVDRGAAELGLRPGLAIGQALALVPGLEIAEAEPDADADTLRRLALWCHAVTPLAAPCPSDGLWLDVTGCAYLAGGESMLLQRLVRRLAQHGLEARAAVADTPGTAHALARHGGEGVVIVQPGGQERALAALPVASLRIPPEMEATLRRLGFDQVDHLTRVPRAHLARRFGPLLGLLLDQAQGRVQEPIDALAPEHTLQCRLAFVEPLLTAESFGAVIPCLAGPLCAEMERMSLGARQLDLVFERVDGHRAAIRIGTAQPSRTPAHLVRLLVERLETIDPGLGVEAMRLVASVAEPLRWKQQEGGATPQAVAHVVDRLANRLGAAAVYSTTPVSSDIPERMAKPAPPSTNPSVLPHVPMPAPDRPIPGTSMPDRGVHRRARRIHLKLIEHVGPFGTLREPSTAFPERSLRLVSRTAAPHGPDLELDPPLLPWKPKPARRPVSRPSVPWPNRLRAPARLLSPPRSVNALAALPDQPPIAFTWRRRHRVRRADGPERIFGEWWQADEYGVVRDYFMVEDEEGQRFWLFRRGDGLHPETGDLRWFLHGLF